ncbi:MAG: YqgE/AlgH family protein [Sphingomonadaceae bacterium]|jgi:putative transcriptional regulator
MALSEDDPLMQYPRFYGGRMLLAMPGMNDPHFTRSAIAMCVHDENGAMGLDVSHAIEQLSVASLLESFGIEAPHLAHMPVVRGGPVEAQRGFVLHGADWSGQDSLIVADEWRLSGSMDILKSIAEGRGPDRFVVALGYSGWGAGQLEHEMTRHGWFLGNVISPELARLAPGQRWDACYAACGVDSRLLADGMGQA